MPTITLRICAFLQICIGFVFFGLMVLTFYQPTKVLVMVFGIPLGEITPLASNSWAQVAVAFGMSAYADIANGLELISSTSSMKHSIPLTITVFNTTRFLISFIWMLKLFEGMIVIHTLSKPWPPLTLFILGILTFDSVLLRPIFVYWQRAWNDEHPSKALVEYKEWEKFSFTQKCCRCVFYYEAILSGLSGITYFMLPQVFAYLYFPELTADWTTLWSFSQFGLLVMTFGLYQMNADIDTHTGHILWWLILDIVWMFYFIAGVKHVHTTFNPFTFKVSITFFFMIVLSITSIVSPYFFHHILNHLIIFSTHVISGGKYMVSCRLSC